MSAADSVRTKLRSASTTGEIAMAFFELVEHPDVRWIDLLKALDGLMVEHAALELHLRLGVVCTATNMDRKRSHWERVLKDRGFSESDVCLPRKGAHAK